MIEQGVSESAINEETNQLQKDTRAKIHQALQKFNIKQVDVAKETGIHHSTLSLWLQGKVKGHFIKIQDTLNEWLDNLYSNKPRYTTLNRSIDKQYNLKPTVLTANAPLIQNIHKVELIPITVELQIEGKRQKQYIMWNLHEPFLTPQQYTKLLIDENSLYAPYQLLISQSVKKGVESYVLLIQNQKKLTIDLDEPCLKIIQIDIQLQNITFKDRFQWDINQKRNIPQEFANDVCQQLGLNAEFYVQISHQMRQQILNFRKQRVQPSESTQFKLRNNTRSVGQQKDKQFDSIVTDSTVNEDNYLRINLQQQYIWQPQVDILDANEVRRHQRLQERKQRYSRRLR